ncbi:hypothetical protein N7471_007589 [Penicillium samsonianum]|uniref:uncharacterized protein n=1 Tax=Penicillium samsonianum TaxID=1882272 RepID=UPI0025483540|nr:uncharacterized protein N7471_007589 [Penicillium samsonianum]KAJ6132374.1 hypothetical protein N7471_007589 [Penicillium samsonianum]
MESFDDVSLIGLVSQDTPFHDDHLPIPCPSDPNLAKETTGGPTSTQTTSIRSSSQIERTDDAGIIDDASVVSDFPLPHNPLPGAQIEEEEEGDGEDEEPQVATSFERLSSASLLCSTFLLIVGICWVSGSVSTAPGLVSPSPSTWSHMCRLQF